MEEKQTISTDDQEIHHPLGNKLSLRLGRLNRHLMTWNHHKISELVRLITNKFKPKFGSKLGSVMRETHGAITKSRYDIEHYLTETSISAQAVSFITFVQGLKRKLKECEPDIQIFGSGEKTLHRQRYQFPSGWLYVDQIEAGLQMEIVAEDKVVQNEDVAKLKLEMFREIQDSVIVVRQLVDSRCVDDKRRTVTMDILEKMNPPKLNKVEDVVDLTFLNKPGVVHNLRK
ncbi:hypothetical protein PSTG_09801 [Puccinia striiformis f. sp. tritici PST-78]|uniref:Uncharacterized protein n=1 Tax=Puccinia striiformis f. sp. tritici PST-78 TaxID=1165861 RepID=A0A0L0VCB3_9BASI|nr:hypothetical protein PSTG_09801 [Puccinia striiformis f. sp. tritici PST-78]